MLRDPKQERRLAMMDKLPDIVRIIKTYPSNVFQLELVLDISYS